MTTTKQYDNLNRLTGLWSVNAQPAILSSNRYVYNSANQRTTVTNVDSSRWVYQYDALGQVVSGKKYWADGSLVAGQQFEYGFDDIGNRKLAKTGGDAAGANLRQSDYSANNLNQTTSRTVPGYVDVLGAAANTATVTVNNQATYRKGDYFRAELTAATTSPLWFGVTNVAVLNNGTNADIVASTTGFVFVAQSPEVFSHDLDGNLTNSGSWAITWDAENRLTSFTRNSAAPSGSKVKLDCAYDYLWRRTQKIVSTWNGSAYVAQSTNKFVYDGWNLIALLDATNGLVLSFTWGLDASGTLQGAGGVGGLISMTVHQGTNAGTYFYCFDGNHNVATLVNATNGAIGAQYACDSFLGIIQATGPLAFVNPFVGSTKFYDWETGFYYYGYRYYDPTVGRWLSRDPIGESGGRNIYGLVNNAPIQMIDAHGLQAAFVPGYPVNPFTGAPLPGHPEFRPSTSTSRPRQLSLDDLERIRKALDTEARKTTCCRDPEKGGPNAVKVSIHGASFAGHITYNTTLETSGSIYEDSYQYYWWNCLSAQTDYANAGSPSRDDWHWYGWYKGENSGGGYHKGISQRWHDNWPYLDVSDGGRWNWQVAVLFKYCGKDNRQHVGLTFSEPEEWDWDTFHEMWVNPHSGRASDKK